MLIFFTIKSAILAQNKRRGEDLILNGDSLIELKKIEDGIVDCIITSPPYYQLRKYGDSDLEIGQEDSVKDYIDKLKDIFSECKRVLKDSGTMFINISDTYVGTSKGLKMSKGIYNDYNFRKNPVSIPRKSLIGIPERLMISLIDDGWILRNKIIWHKPNAMPSSVKDRFTVDYEVVYFFTKTQKYYFNQLFEIMSSSDLSNPRGSVGVVGNLNSGRRKQDSLGIKTYTGFNDRYTFSDKRLRNKRSVWSISTVPSEIDHFAMMPGELVELLLEAGCPMRGLVLDPFAGAGTTLVVAKENDLDFIGIELYENNVEIIKKRLEITARQIRFL